jgi:hypothetical protein
MGYIFDNPLKCSVCGKRVDANNNMIAEHQDQRGKPCYGSFMPAQNYNPFHVQRNASWYEDAVEEFVLPPNQEPQHPVEEEYLEADEFLNELNELT